MIILIASSSFEQFIKTQSYGKLKKQQCESCQNLNYKTISLTTAIMCYNCRRMQVNIIVNTQKYVYHIHDHSSFRTMTKIFKVCDNVTLISLSDNT